MAFFTELDKKILQFICKHKRPQIAKAILRKKNGAGEIRLPYFRIYYKTTVNKTVQNWHKDRLIDQQDRIESLGINPGIHGQLIYNKGDKSVKWRKESFFNKWGWGK